MRFLGAELRRVTVAISKLAVEMRGTRWSEAILCQVALLVLQGRQQGRNTNTGSE